LPANAAPLFEQIESDEESYSGGDDDYVIEDDTDDGVPVPVPVPVAEGNVPMTEGNVPEAT
jgi:hypothetical protein